MNVRLRIRSVPRDVAGLADDALGESLVELVRYAVGRGAAPTVATIARPDRVEIIGLEPILEHRLPLHGFLASLTRAELSAPEDAPPVGEPRAIGLMGTVQVRRPHAGVDAAPMAVVFLEWPDCRWWHWRALIDPSTNTLREGTDTLSRAIDGDPLPDGLGRWWSLGRRQPTRARIAMHPDAPVVH